MQNRPAGGQRIGGGAGGGGDDQAVGALGEDEFAVDKHFKLDHLAGTAAREHHIVERQPVIDFLPLPRDGRFQQQAFADQIFAGEHAGELFKHVFAGNLGEKAQMPLVDTDQRHAVGRGGAGGGKESAVAAEH